MGVVINLTAVLAAAVVQMILGFLWYGPIFGKPWMRLVGLNQSDIESAKKKGMAKQYATAFIGTLVNVYVLAYFVGLGISTTGLEGMQLGFLLWLGFAAPVLFSQMLWLGKSKTLFMIDSGYYLVALILNGMLLTVWR